MSNTGPIRVSSAEFVRRFGSWQDRAATDPVLVTHHGRPRLVLLSSLRYQQLVEHGADHADEATGDLELRLATLLDQLDAGFVALDGELRIIAMNTMACSYLRVRREQGGRYDPGETLPDLDRSIVRTHLARTLASGESGLFDTPSLAYPGQWLRVQCFPYSGGVGLLFRNVSGEREARRRAAAAAALDAAMASHGRIGTGQLNQRAAIVSADGGLEALAGVAAGGLDHRPFIELLAPAARAEAVAAIEAVLSEGTAGGFDGRLGDAAGCRVRIGLAALRGDHMIEGAAFVMTARDDG